MHAASDTDPADTRSQDKSVTEIDAPSGAVAGDGTATCPPAYPIKGNASSMNYHAPGRASYDGTVPEWCFATEEDALDAGYRAPGDSHTHRSWKQEEQARQGRGHQPRG
jgi:hypothetical protein